MDKNLNINLFDRKELIVYYDIDGFNKQKNCLPKNLKLLDNKNIQMQYLNIIDNKEPHNENFDLKK